MIGLTRQQAEAIIKFLNKEKVESLKPNRMTVRTGDYRIGLSKAIEIIEDAYDKKRNPKWIQFDEVVIPGRKTKVFLVYNKENTETPIGEIKWYGAFRKYSFFPQPHTVYESVCMQDITNFLDELMEERRAAKENEKHGIRETHEVWNDPHKMVKVSDDPLNYERREL